MKLLHDRRTAVLAHRAFTDRLTGLYSYDYFVEALDHELRRAHRYGGNVSLVVLDLDALQARSTTSTATPPATLFLRAGRRARAAHRPRLRHARPVRRRGARGARPGHDPRGRPARRAHPPPGGGAAGRHLARPRGHHAVRPASRASPSGARPRRCSRPPTTRSTRPSGAARTASWSRAPRAAGTPRSPEPALGGEVGAVLVEGARPELGAEALDLGDLPHRPLDARTTRSWKNGSSRCRRDTMFSDVSPQVAQRTAQPTSCSSPSTQASAEG